MSERAAGRPARPMPDDFPTYARIEGNLKLRKRFGARGDVIERWRRELGIVNRPPGCPRKALAKVTAVRRIKRRLRMAQEQIEDLGGWDDFDLGRSLGIHTHQETW